MINQKMLAVLREFVAESETMAHDHDYCSRTSECDDAAAEGIECSYCTGSGECSECDCGVAQWQEIVSKAIKVINEAAQSS